MIKTVDKVHCRSKVVRIGPCYAQGLYGAYRTLVDEETGMTFCMMMKFTSSSEDKVDFYIHKDDEYMKLFFEDVERDFDREYFLRDHGSIELPEAIKESKEYKRVYDQLFRNMSKLLANMGCKLNEDLTFEDIDEENSDEE